MIASALWILAVWTAASVLAIVPIVLWFRAQARKNEARTREARRRAWLEEADGQTVAR